jgi:hypothetical protein
MCNATGIYALPKINRMVVNEDWIVNTDMRVLAA